MSGFKAHFLLMARYNSRLNQQVFHGACQLTDAQLNEDRGAFFNSIIGTLNHLMVADLLWLNRCVFLHAHTDEPIETRQFKSLAALKNFPQPSALNQLLYQDIKTLMEKRVTLDAILSRWLNDDSHESDFKMPLTYRNTKGETASRNFGHVLTHLFNHQTHHRGQITTLLSQLGIDIGSTDLLLDITLI